MTQERKLEEAVPTRADTELTREVRQFVPDVDIYQSDDGLTLLADLPGVKSDGLDVKLEKNILTIYGRTDPTDTGERNPATTEYETGDYYRAFTLSEEIDQEKIEASLDNGVLTLHLPKSEKARARKIAVAVA